MSTTPTPTPPHIALLATKTASEICPLVSENYANQIERAEAQNENVAIRHEQKRIAEFIESAITRASLEAGTEQRKCLEDFAFAISSVPDMSGKTKIIGVSYERLRKALERACPLLHAAMDAERGKEKTS